MKTRLAILLSCLAALSGLAQGFVNLNFENCTLSTNLVALVNTGDAFPGWTVYRGGVAQSQVAYNGALPGQSFLGLLATSRDFLPLSGHYNAFLDVNPSDTIDVALAQSGQIPVGTSSLQFMTSGVNPIPLGGLTVTFANTLLSLQPVNVAPGYTLWSADISAFAGLTGELRFTGNHSAGDWLARLDDITLVPVPEPSTWALLALGSALFAGLARRRRDILEATGPAGRGLIANCPLSSCCGSQELTATANGRTFHNFYRSGIYPSEGGAGDFDRRLKSGWCKQVGRTREIMRSLIIQRTTDAALALLIAASLAGCATESHQALTPEKTASAGTTYTGGRSTLIVGKFDNRSSYMRGLFSDGVDRLGAQSKTILIGHLQGTGRFQVADRDNMDELAREAKLKGQQQALKGADFAITGDVTEFGRKEVGDMQLFGILGSGKKQIAYAKVTLNVVDVLTSEVVYSVAGAGEYALSNREVVGFGSTAAYDSTLNGKVLDLAIREAINRLVEGLEQGKWKPNK